MIVALQRLAVAGAFEDDFAAAMAAYVGEGAKGAVVVSGDDDWDVADSGCEEITGATYLSGVADVVPRTMEDALLLSAEDFWIYVPSGG